MPDYIAIRHRLMRREFKKLATAYDGFADRSEADGDTSSECFYRAVSARIRRILNKCDAQGRPVQTDEDPNSNSVHAGCPVCATSYNFQITDSNIESALRGQVCVYPCPNCGAGWTLRSTGPGQNDFALCPATIGTSGHSTVEVSDD